MKKKKRVTGIGGIFFKTTNTDTTKSWYQKHLGIKTDAYGAGFKSRQWANPEKSHYLQWSPMNDDTDYFSPSTKPYMINYRVEDLEWLVIQLRKEGVTILDEMQTFDYGKFIHILDPDGNKIELWEPVDQVFDQYYNNDSDKNVNY